jgi:hypothetical protein
MASYTYHATTSFSVYIISSNEEKQILPDIQSDKLKSIFTKVEPISDSIKRHNNHYEQDSLIMIIILSSKYTKKQLQKLNRTFLY